MGIKLLTPTATPAGLKRKNSVRVQLDISAMFFP